MVMSFVCECGSRDFHTFYRYVSKDIERFRCKKCKKTYQREGKVYREIDLKVILNNSSLLQKVIEGDF